MLGRAVLTTEMSRTTRIWAARATASRAHDFRWPSSSVCGAGVCGRCGTSELLGWCVVRGRVDRAGGAHGVARGEPVRTAETTSVMARTDSVAPGSSSTRPAWVASTVRCSVVGRERRELVLRGDPARVVEVLGGREDDERTVLQRGEGLGLLEDLGDHRHLVATVPERARRSSVMARPRSPASPGRSGGGEQPGSGRGGRGWGAGPGRAASSGTGRRSSGWR